MTIIGALLCGAGALVSVTGGLFCGRGALLDGTGRPSAWSGNFLRVAFADGFVRGRESVFAVLLDWHVKGDRVFRDDFAE